MPGPEHFQQTQLSPTAAQLIEAFAEWVHTTADWRKVQDGLYICTDPKQEDQLHILRMEQVIPRNASAVRILRLTPSGKGAPIFTSSGSLRSIYPLRGPNPTISGHNVPIGYVITFEGPVVMYPTMDILTHSIAGRGEGASESDASKANIQTGN